jgi:Cof subfamily protein (haloacid dehalogenase superfamily)
VYPYPYNTNPCAEEGGTKLTDFSDLIHARDLIQWSTALYSDVDGTLVPASNQISPLVVQEIGRFVDAGFHFTLATGRNFAGVQRLLRSVPITDPIVLCNGAYVYDPSTKKDAYVSITSETAQHLLSRLERLTNIVVYVDTADHTFWVSQVSATTEPYAMLEQLNPRLFTDANEVTLHHDIIKIGVKLLDASQQTRLQLEELFNDIERELPQQLHYCFSNPSYLEFMQAGVSKWSGIQSSQRLKSQRQDDVLIAVGDEHNDLEMVKQAHIGVAMGNAVDAVKHAAHHCIGTVDEDGMAHFLRYLRTQIQAISS